MKKEYTHDNIQVVHYLDGYFSYDDAVKEYPVLDDIVTGVCNLDYGGNRKPLSKSTIFMLLSNLPNITVTSIQDVMDNSKGHASKLASGVRIASSTFQNYMESLDRQSEEYQERLAIANAELSMHALFVSLRSDREAASTVPLRCHKQRQRTARAHAKKVGDVGRLPLRHRAG
jgi:hypothetical protein